MMSARFLIFLLCLPFSPALAQEPPSFRFPAACTPGADCWVMNYVDMGPEDGKDMDPLCQTRTYDGHKGTDIALRSKAEMEAGVAALAAMDGKVLRTRSGEPDRFPTEEDLALSKEQQKECGNAVLIDHGNKLQTI